MTQHENLTFIDTDKTLLETYEMPSFKDGDVLLTQTLSLTADGQQYHRRIYSVFHAMAFVGGLGYVLMSIFSFFLTPCAAYSFRMRALKRLYFARTSDLGIFELDSRRSSSRSG